MNKKHKTKKKKGKEKDCIRNANKEYKEYKLKSGLNISVFSPKQKI